LSYASKKGSFITNRFVFLNFKQSGLQKPPARSQEKPEEQDFQEVSGLSESRAAEKKTTFY